MSFRRFLPVLAASFGVLSSAHAATAWDESVSGDLSNVGTSPTLVSLSGGANIIRGATGRSDGVVDRDYFSFTLQSGLQLDEVFVLPGTTFVTPSDAGFIAVQTGPQVTVNPTGGSATGLLGWVHYSVNDMNTDILGIIGLGFGSAGFATPLPAGTYSFWIQNTATGVSAYNFDFRVSAVPETSTSVMFLLGFALVGAGRAIRR